MRITVARIVTSYHAPLSYIRAICHELVNNRATDPGWLSFTGLDQIFFTPKRPVHTSTKSALGSCPRSMTHVPETGDKSRKNVATRHTENVKLLSDILWLVGNYIFLWGSRSAEHAEHVPNTLNTVTKY